MTPINYPCPPHAFDPAREQWRGVPGYPAYQVSDHGRVRSLTRSIALRGPGGRTRRLPGRLLRPFKTGAGYWCVSLGKGKLADVHRLVALAFHGPPPAARPEAAHGPGGQLDNRSVNVRWASRSENEEDKALHADPACCATRAKLTPEAARAIRAAWTGRRGDVVRLARLHGVDRRTITHILHRTGWVDA